MRVIPALALVCLLTACGTPADPVPPTVVGAQDSWEQLTGSPLSPREGPVVAVVGTEAVVVGGYAGPPCPPGADCELPPDAYRVDGAALDVADRTWRRIADAPLRVPAMAPRAVVGSELFVLVRRVLLVWRSETDAWRQVALPSRAPSWATLLADGDRLVVGSASDEQGERPDLALDVATGRWTPLPPDPLGRSFDRALTPTPSGLVLTAHQLVGDGPADPSLVRAAVLPPGATEWRVLPASDQLGGWRWAWTGERLVDVTLGGADGGEVDGYGRVIPFGGRLDVDAGTWSPLPDAPAERTGGWPVEAPSGPVVAAEGWLYDDRTEEWATVPVPPEAPREPGPAVWVGDRLVVVGGVDWPDDAFAGSSSVPDEADLWPTDAWVYDS
ncbi:hypothetical protein ABFT23_13310 [Nocardioides sp. C4-1]|uniref:hypothetical protein n=1 Tax=Nocardioides sp. C4-1 TaxID=3151851 RepID=UPI003264DBD6